MARALPALAISLGCLAAWVGVAQLAAGQKGGAAVEAATCALHAERFFVRVAMAAEGRVEASYFVLLRNPEPWARAYGLHFDHPPAFDARSGARATLPGDAALPVLLGRCFWAAKSCPPAPNTCHPRGSRAPCGSPAGDDARCGGRMVMG